MTASLISGIGVFAIAVVLQYASAQTCPPDYNVYINATAPGQLVACGTATTGTTTTTCPTGAVCLTVGTNLPQYQQICCVRVGTDLGAGTVGAGSACPSTAVTCSGGSSCISGVCTCPLGTSNSGGICVTISTLPSTPVCTTGQVLINGQCFNQVAPGGQCTVSTQCTGGSLCSNFLCACSTGFVISNGACISSTQTTFAPGTTPFIPPPAPTQMPIAVGCDGSQVLVGGFCYYRVGPDQTCAVNEQCQHGSRCEPIIKTCKCVSPAMNMGGTCATPRAVSSGRR
uniref:EB domain-containing protein n=1 Tax=Plectus sambesii TaxID=2011161 RepID=A0A914WTD0_9BILA